MNKLITLVMYVVWVLAIVFVLATTFTNFQYEDLNLITFLLLGFAVLNSFFVVSINKKKEE